MKFSLDSTFHICDLFPAGKNELLTSLDIDNFVKVPSSLDYDGLYDVLSNVGNGVLKFVNYKVRSEESKHLVALLSNLDSDSQGDVFKTVENELLTLRDVKIWLICSLSSVILILSLCSWPEERNS
jgi:hypothetical protein